MFANLIEKLRKKWRIALIDHESLSQSRQVIFRPLSLLIIAFSAFFLVALGTASLMIFTPVNALIPGAPDPEMDAKFLEMTRVLDSAEVELEAKDKWIAIMQQAASSGVDPDNQPPEMADPAIQPLLEPVENALPKVEQESPEMTPQELSHPLDIKALPLEGNRFNLYIPVDGYVSNKFSYEDEHYGIDIVARENSPIKSVASGFVIFSEYSDETGYVIGVSHGEDLFSFYKHNSMVYKNVGDYVFAGETIAVIGNSGQNSSGTHLHFELWDKGQARDPSDYMVFN